MSDGDARPVDVRVLAEDDVGALIACVRRCYGNSYTEPEFYDSSYLRSELRAHRLFSVACDGRPASRRTPRHAYAECRATGSLTPLPASSIPTTGASA